jgi:hypothetical protein
MRQFELSVVITASAVVHISWDETIGYPNTIGQRCLSRHHICLFVLYKLLHILVIILLTPFLQVQHTL